MQIPFPHPFQQKRNLLHLRLPDRNRRQEVGRIIDRLIGKESVLVPVMDCVRNQNKWFGNRARSIVHSQVERRCVRGGGTPGIDLPVYKCEAGIGDVEAAVLVDCGYVWRGRDVEGADADYGLVFEGVCTRDKRQDAFRNTGAGLEVAPLCAVLWIVRHSFAERWVRLTW